MSVYLSFYLFVILPFCHYAFLLFHLLLFKHFVSLLFLYSTFLSFYLLSSYLFVILPFVILPFWHSVFNSLSCLLEQDLYGFDLAALSLLSLPPFTPRPAPCPLPPRPLAASPGAPGPRRTSHPPPPRCAPYGRRHPRHPWPPRAGRAAATPNCCRAPMVGPGRPTPPSRSPASWWRVNNASCLAMATTSACERTGDWPTLHRPCCRSSTWSNRRR